MSKGPQSREVAKLRAERDEARQERDEWQLQCQRAENILASDVERKSEANYRAGLEAQLADARKALWSVMKRIATGDLCPKCDGTGFVYSDLDERLEECPDCRATLAPEVRKAEFQVGDQVVKVSGYPFPGEIRSVFTTKEGAIRYVVEATGDGYGGMLHIFRGEQLFHSGGA